MARSSPLLNGESPRHSKFQQSSTVAPGSLLEEQNHGALLTYCISTYCIRAVVTVPSVTYLPTEVWKALV